MMEILKWSCLAMENRLLWIGALTPLLDML